MTEKEKQQAGELYSPNDRELVADKVKARKLCVEFNNAECNDYQKKERLLDRLLALRGDNVTLEPNFYCNFGYNTVIGNNFHAEYNCVIIDNADVTFGDNIFIGPNCSFNTTVKPEDAETRSKGLEYAKPVKIGSDVQIGGNVTVAAGVTIGSNVIITPGSSVTEDIPSNCIASGTPAKPVKALAPVVRAEKPAQEAEKAPEEEKKSEPPKPRTRRLEIHRVEP
ncbi:MAG: sugar O-acetyltransferase [Ruminococcus sp.]|nr:sugar O-acetyltransferase [Ruminococcus sp.]